MPAQAIQRSKVLWFGPAPQDGTNEFANRDLHLGVNVQNAASEFRFARTVVFRFNAEKPSRFIADLKEYAPRAIDNGLNIMLVADDETGLNNIEHALTRFAIPGDSTKRTAPPLYEIAEFAARHLPGAADNPALEIVADSTAQLSDEQYLLFRRAFWDCHKIIIQHFDRGRSGNVCCVYATFSDSKVGPRPLPFFAKIDLKDKIVRELDNYKEYTEHFVPFSARPNLDHSRCLVGSSSGIIVGNFVEQSETLWDVAIRGHANKALHSLFDEALRCWHLQAYQENSPPIPKKLFEALESDRNGPIIKIEKFTEERVRSAFTLGSTLKPEELIRLADSLPPFKCRFAPIHGDLHAKNVRVRNADAILIDFYLTRPGPILADLASLESTLIFAAVNADDENENWKKTVDTLFSKMYMEHAPPPAREPQTREWLWNIVRQIRQVALGMQTSDFEYATLLGIYSLHCAQFAPDYPPEEYRRAYAYVVAEQLLKMVAEEYSRKK
jgi:thiamine kinase-like enzyme